jgi:hypothetical protein
VQADQIRGMGGVTNPRAGRRPIAQFLHDPAVQNPPSSGPPGSVPIALDGSVAAFVPARRALSWQLTAPNGTPVVHERYWLTVQPGEIRMCTSCHGMSEKDQAGNVAPVNAPQALGTLLAFWKQQNPAPPAGEGFFPITPCRLLDTREPDGAGGGPVMVGQGARVLLAGSRCGVPASATALSVNVTVTNATAAGEVVLYADGTALPSTSNVRFRPGVTRANSAIVAVSADGRAAIRIANATTGTLHVVVDVNGYFQD